MSHALDNQFYLIVYESIGILREIIFLLISAVLSCMVSIAVCADPFYSIVVYPYFSSRDWQKLWNRFIQYHPHHIDSITYCFY